MKKLLSMALLGATLALVASAPAAHAWYPPQDPGESGAGGADPGSSGCGGGYRLVCRLDETRLCTRWSSTSLTGGGSPTCQEWYAKITPVYWDGC